MDEGSNVQTQVSAGASKELSSFFLFGKNLRLIGASVKDCVLLYKRTEGEVMIQMMMMIAQTLMMKNYDDDDVEEGEEVNHVTDLAAQEAEGGRLETFLICAGPGAQPTLVKRLTFR